MQEIAKQRALDMERVLNENLFPMEIVPDQFHDWLAAALMHETSEHLNCSSAMLKSMHKIAASGTREINIQQMGFSCNCIESKTPAQLGLKNDTRGHQEYIYMLDTIDVLAIRWKSITDSLNEPIISKFKAMEGRVLNNKPLLLPKTEILS